jgi:hypothetical protein
MQINADSEPNNCAITALEKRSTSYAKTDLAHWRRRVFRQPNSPNWFAEISARGIRRKLSLETPNKENAALRARDIYQLARFSGWDAVLEKYRPKEAQAKTDLTIGDFITLATSVANVQKVTLRGYTGALRKIVSDLEGLDPGKTKFDPYNGGHQKWIKRVDDVNLAKVTPQKIQQWKRSFLSKAAPDPISQRSAKVSVNTFLRQARSLFSPKILKHLGFVRLPDPLPFAGIQFEPRQSLKFARRLTYRLWSRRPSLSWLTRNPNSLKPSCSPSWWGCAGRKSISLNGIRSYGRQALSEFNSRNISMPRPRIASAT